MVPAYSLQSTTDLEPGNHLCSLYETEEERRALLTPFLCQGLERGEKVLYIVDAHSAEVVLDYLRDDGLEVEPYLASGQLSILTVDDAYMREGVFDPDGMIALLRAETEQALAEGYSALRLTGEMTWTLRGLPGSERLIEYEAKLNEFLPGSKCLAICQYDRRRFDPAVLLDVLCTHPIAVVGTAVYDNSYYVPPVESLDHDPSAAQLRHWLDNLAECRRAEEALKRRLEQLTSLNRASQAVTASLELDQVLAEIVSLAGEVVASDYASVWLVDEEGRLGQSAEYLPGVPYIINDRIRDRGFANWIVRSRQAIVVDDTDEDGTVHPRPANGAPCTVSLPITKAGVRSFVGLPLVVKDRLLGVLFLGSLRPGNFRGQLPLPTTFANQAAVAIENARLFEQAQREVVERKQAEEEIRRRAAHQEALNAIAAAVSQSLDLKEVLDAALEKTLAVLKIEDGGIHLLEPDGGGLTLQVYRGASEELVEAVRRLRLDEGISGQAVAEGRPVVLDVQDYPTERLAPYIVKEGFQTLVSTPLISKGKALGTLTLDTRRPRAFPPQELGLLVAIGHQIGVAIENARLYQNEQKRAAQLAVVSEVAHRAASILDVNQLLQEAAIAIQQDFNYYGAALYLLDEAAGELELMAIAGGFGDMAAPCYRQVVGMGIIGWAAETGQSLLVNDVSQEPRYILGFLTAPLTKSELCVPLKLGDRVIGVLDVQDTRLNAFDEMDLMAMETLADQLAVAIQNARLHQEVQQRVEELVFLDRIGRAVTSSLDLEQILTTIMRKARDVLKTEAASVMLLDDQGKELVFKTAVGSQAEGVEGLRLPLEQSIAGWIVREGRPLLVPDVREDPRFYPGIDQAAGSVTRSVLGVPLEVKGRLLGVIEAVNKIEGDFSQSDVELLSSMAQWAAIAIDNAWLFQAVGQQREQLRALATRLAEAQEAERRRLAGELHDLVGQNLAALGIDLNIMQAQMPKEAANLIGHRLTDSLALVKQTTKCIRDMMADLRPPVLDDYGLVAALHWYGKQFASRMGIAVTAQGEKLVPRLAAPIENALFRITQEALTNVAKHAQATQVTVAVEVDRRTVRLVIADDGIGFDPTRLAEPDGGRGWGLLTMKERAEAVGGYCCIESSPRQGTRLVVEVGR